MERARPISIAHCSSFRLPQPVRFRELAAEGGMDSAFWAGKRDPKKPVRITLTAGFGHIGHERPAYLYEIAIGLIPIDRETGKPLGAAFPLEPQIKEEHLIHRHGRR